MEESIKNYCALSQDEYLKVKYLFLTVSFEIIKLVMMTLLFNLMKISVKPLTLYFIILQLRLFSGGLHFKSFWTCFIFSFLMFLAIVAGSQVISITYFTMALLIICTWLVVLVGPMQSNGRPKKTRQKNKTCKRITCLIYLINVGIVLAIPASQYAKLVTCSIILVTIQTITAKGVNIYENTYPTNR